MGFIGNYIGNLASIATGRQPVRPLLFSYYITHRCNLNCQYCSDWKGRSLKETINDPVGNILTDDIMKGRRRLWDVQKTKECAQYWTSCRGLAESMFKPPRLRQLGEFYHSVRGY